MGTDETATAEEAFDYFIGDLPACDYIAGTDQWEGNHGYPSFVIIDITDPENPVAAYQESSVDYIAPEDFAAFIDNF